MGERLDEKSLKSSIGFGTAFKATLGFYAAKFVAGLIEFLLVCLFGAIVGTIVYFFAK